MNKNKYDKRTANKHFKSQLEISSLPLGTNPENCFEQINTYGTYEIQPTCNTDNDFPAISQGLPSKEIADIPEDFDQGIRPKLNEDGEENKTRSSDSVVQGYASETK